MEALTRPLARTRALPQRLRRWSRLALDLVLPPVCFACRAPVGEPHGLCAACWSRIDFLDGPCCAHCGLPFELDPGPQTLCAQCLTAPPAYDRAISAVRYDDASKVPILALKRADRLDIVPGFVRWLERAGRSLLREADLVVPVPLHPLRLWQRRYNQAALLSAGLAKSAGLGHAPQVLTRVRATPSQGTMPSAAARRRNVQGAFAVPANHEALITGRTVLLVDDVFTTGATLEACARALKRGGATRVLVLTLARVVRQG